MKELPEKFNAKKNHPQLKAIKKLREKFKGTDSVGWNDENHWTISVVKKNSK